MSFLSRRSFLIGATATFGATVVGACGPPSNSASLTNTVEERERIRRREGAPVRVLDLAAVAGPVELGPLVVDTWSYQGTVPGPEIRIRAGEVLQVRFKNKLPAETTIHWHGIALRNDMDGVPGVTQDPIPAGGDFTYEFTVPDPGTYFFHPHVGVQLDRGLYGSLIVEDPKEPGGYDREVVMVLDDWTDGVGESPDDILARLTDGGMEGMGHPGMGMDSETSGMAMSDVLGGDAGDVLYPLYLINGRAANDPQVIEAKAGERLRLRIVNASSDTAFRLAIGGHSFTVTQSDGFPVVPTEGEALLIGMGERYDVEATIREGVIPVVALAEGKGGRAVLLIRAGTGEPPPAEYLPDELTGRLITVENLAGDTGGAPASAEPDRIHRLVLDGDMMSYRWTINGEVWQGTLPLDVSSGETVRLEFDNRSTMFHPMHLHGHTFELALAGGARKDTVIVKPGQVMAADFEADNPGLWVVHCHNIYHAEAGMMTGLTYTS